jgi:hypothetical protein
MNWMNIAWPMVGAPWLTLALMNLHIAIGQTPRLPYPASGVAAAPR